MNPVEQHILNQKEPFQSIMLYVRSLILKTLPTVEEKYSYRIPFYYCHKKSMCFLNILKGKNYVDVVFMDGRILEEKYPQLKNDNNRKRVRSIQVKSLEDFDELQFVKLLLEASQLIKVSKSQQKYV